MSHLSTVKSNIKDINILKNVLIDMGFKPIENDLVYSIEADSEKCELAIKVGQYAQSSVKVGWKKNKTGTYGLVCDFWSFSMVKSDYAEFLSKVTSAYKAKEIQKDINKNFSKANVNVLVSI